MKLTRTGVSPGALVLTWNLKQIYANFAQGPERKIAIKLIVTLSMNCMHCEISCDVFQILTSSTPHRNWHFWTCSFLFRNPYSALRHQNPWRSSTFLAVTIKRRYEPQSKWRTPNTTSSDNRGLCQHGTSFAVNITPWRVMVPIDFFDMRNRNSMVGYCRFREEKISANRS